MKTPFPLQARMQILKVTASKGFEGAINTILNKRDLKQLDVELNNEALKALTENFSLDSRTTAMSLPG